MYFRIPVCLLISALFLTSCVSSKNGKSDAAQESQAIDSFVLVKSLPVCLSSDDPLYKLEIKVLLIELLKKSGYEVITINESIALLKEGVTKEYSDKEKMKDFLDKSKSDRMYLFSAMEKMQPIFQSINFQPCKDSSDNCFVLSRGNPPGLLKTKQWIFKYKETDDYSNLINHIFKALTE